MCVSRGTQPEGGADPSLALDSRRDGPGGLSWALGAGTCGLSTELSQAAPSVFAVHGPRPLLRGACSEL